MDPLSYALWSAWGLGADWGSSPVPCRCCHLWVGLEGEQEGAVTGDCPFPSASVTVIVALLFTERFPLHIFSCRGSGRRRPEGTVGAQFSVHGFLGNCIREGMEELAGDPESVQQHGELTGHGDQGAALDALAAIGQAQSPLL